MSDWGGTNSTVESVLAGCDLEMPGPPEKRGKLLLKRVTENNSTHILEAIDASCLRILSLLKDLNLLGLSPEEAAQTRKQPETSSDTPEDRRLLRSVAADSMVLLKNSASILPLLPTKLQGKRIALIGPNAKHGTPGGGGSATMNPQYQTQPLGALKSMLDAKNISAEVISSPGALTHKWLPLVTSDRWSAPSLEGEEQVMLELKYFSTPDFSGEATETQHRSSSHVDLFDSAPKFFYTDPKLHSLVLASVLTPFMTGLHTFEISSVGKLATVRGWSTFDRQL
jgi:beta-glucosidase